MASSRAALQLVGAAFVLFFVGVFAFRLLAGYRGLALGDYGWYDVLGALQISSPGFLATAWLGALVLRPAAGARLKAALAAGIIGGAVWGFVAGWFTWLGMEMCFFMCDAPDPAFPWIAGFLHGAMLLLACLVAAARADRKDASLQGTGLRWAAVDFAAASFAVVLLLQPTQGWPYEMARGAVDRLGDGVAHALGMIPTMGALAALAAVTLRPHGPKALARALAWGGAAAGAWGLALLAARGGLAVDRFTWLIVLQALLVLAALVAGGGLASRQPPDEPAGQRPEAPAP